MTENNDQPIPTIENYNHLRMLVAAQEELLTFFRTAHNQLAQKAHALEQGHHILQGAPRRIAEWLANEKPKLIGMSADEIFQLLRPVCNPPPPPPEEGEKKILRLPKNKPS